MIFDQILPETITILGLHRNLIEQLEWLVINRDLNSRVRLIVPEAVECDETLRAGIMTVARDLSSRLGPHAYPPEVAVLYEARRDFACRGGAAYILSEFKDVWVVDRLATEANWARIEPETQGVPRIVFFSIKGGVGRSAALAATAWKLAEEGKRVLVLDLDLESPGLSTALLPADRQPTFGITDWLVEDLVENTTEIFNNMVATSALSHDGEIYVVPAHGANPGEYVAKLGRVWMPKLMADGTREAWSTRLGRLLQNLEERICPDVIMIDSRSGIDDIASACITDIGATLVLLFALEGEQTWNGYRMLFEQWQRAEVAEAIRGRLQVVGALVPEWDGADYFHDLCDHAYELFVNTLYDEIAPPESDTIGIETDGEGKWRVGDLVEGWSFDEADEDAPHYPWEVKWHRNWTGRRSLHKRLSTIEYQEIDFIFGPLVNGVSNVVGSE
ncbi:hypothetical protein Gxy13693_032_002 [Komagataeibacter xylinus NBRC 13693]|uniref:ArsA/GET3 Anion-transporting ATPase-like domain-containing protein n=1 Tax=Komagataeibacter xylinus NBRC 13693 TaxID=1234668 RepID=A0A0D6Q8A5_KOMXY|nr:ArsA-related P-loop ATPase [Komagataeibacter xylinus]GAN99742.1 hypothetical protein Gxy13693_032_002 [Komagataeibacter xylinus NBRC 13693]